MVVLVVWDPGVDYTRWRKAKVHPELQVLVVLKAGLEARSTEALGRLAKVDPRSTAKIGNGNSAPPLSHPSSTLPHLSHLPVMLVVPKTASPSVFIMLKRRCQDD